MGSRDKVLIVDDSELDRIALKKMLKDAYEIVEAVDGAGALRILESQKEFDAISAIILDLVMPQMDGFEFLREYRKVDSYRRIPVIVASVERDVKTEKACLALGARDFIGKPYDPQIVRFRVENAVRSSEQQLSRELRYRADYDMLTGIYNKTHFFEATRVLLKRHPEETYAFLRLDIEKFQLVNSFFGSSSGDGLLQYIAKEIRKFAGDTEQIAYGRIEADIFGICMPYRGEETMLELVRYMRMRLGQYQLAFDVVPAIGIYVIRERDLSVDAMYDRANLAAKQCKGNYIENYAFYVDEMREDIVREQQIVNHMRHALDEEEFVLYLQPKYSLQDNRICGAEVLVRWAKPEGGMISPGEFIPIFERNGFITKLDYYVWEKTCKLLAGWIAEGKKPSPVSVNISRVSLYNPRLVEAICGLTDRYHIPPGTVGTGTDGERLHDEPEGDQGDDGTSAEGRIFYSDGRFRKRIFFFKCVKGYCRGCAQDRYEVSVGYGSGGAQPEYSCVGCAHGKMAESPGDCRGRREKGAGGLSAQRRM